MKTLNKPLSILLALGLALSAPAGARDRDGGSSRNVDERRAVKADARVSVSNVAGLIEIEAWDRKEVRITGELGPDVEELKITGNEASLKIEVKLPEDDDHVDDGDARLKLQVPIGAHVDAEGVSCDIRVRGLKGEVTAQTVSGDVKVQVESQRVKVSSVSGDVVAEAPSGETRAASVSGDVTVRGARGELEVESVSGDITVLAAGLKRLDAETVSGDLELDLDLSRDADVEAETLSGEVRLALPALPAGDIRIETFSGEIRSDFWAPRGGDERKDYRQDGTGKGHLRLNSFSGDVVLRKK